MAKHIVKFGSTTNASGETINEPAVDVTSGAVNWAMDKSACSRMDVVINLKTLTGTNPTITFTINERFSDAGFAQTAKSKALSATGIYHLMQGATPADQVSVLQQGAYWSLGTGTDKQVVTTVGGTVGTVSADIYFIFYSDFT